MALVSVEFRNIVVMIPFASTWNTRSRNVGRESPTVHTESRSIGLGRKSVLKDLIEIIGVDSTSVVLDLDADALRFDRKQPQREASTIVP